MAFVSPEYLDELRARVAVSTVAGRRVKLVKKGREYSGLCPFHSEKTPSFTINDERGFYHCFGCGANGDVISFVTETEGLNFVEAVEQLSALAGLEMPRPDRQAREKSARRASLYDVTEAACAWFEAQLQGAQGAVARRYLADRGVTAQSCRGFRLGYAPPDGLQAALATQGIATDKLVAAGLVKARDSGGCYDFFRGRVIFPITDRRGRVIAFGGRALGEAQPKYLNSPDTELFHKGKVLYNMAAARQATRREENLLVVEGYMDVVALTQVGFSAVVAPLGTAVTTDQLLELWRMVREPVICLDGDAAGLRAAGRAVARALPELGDGRSLRFATLPAGEDPDSLVQRGGAGAFGDVLAQARPLSDVLWQDLRAAQSLETPERRAAFRAALRRRVGVIGDRETQDEYRREMFRRLDALFAPQKKSDRRPFQSVPPLRRLPPPPRRVNLIHRAEQVLLAALINHPMVLAQHVEELAASRLSDSRLQALLHELLMQIMRDPDLDSASLKAHLFAKSFGLDKLLCDDVYHHGHFARPATDSHEAGYGVAHILSLFRERVAAQTAPQQRQALLEALLDEEQGTEALARHDAHKQTRREETGVDIDLDAFDLDGSSEDEKFGAQSDE